MVEKAASLAIWRSYPLGCGLGTSVHVSVIGSVRIAPLGGDKGVGGGGTGLL